MVEGAALEMLCTQVPRVRIPNSPPNVHGNFDRIIVGFFHAQKPLEIKVFPISEYKRTPLQSIYAAEFSTFSGSYDLRCRCNR